MTLKEAINIRQSRRKFIPTPIAAHASEKLQELITEYHRIENLRMELVLNDGSAFNGLRKSYGMFSGVANYIGLIGDSNNAGIVERLGYYGELLMLNAVAMGLGTCWVGGSFSRSSCPFKLTDNEMIICTITVGNVEESKSLKERFIRGITHRKAKTVEDMFTSDEPVPDWFMEGMKAVEKAPSAVNRQPVFFTYKDGIVTAEVKDITDIGTALDLGIAKLHFEIGVGSGSWSWGNHAKFLMLNDRK